MVIAGKMIDQRRLFMLSKFWIHELTRPAFVDWLENESAPVAVIGIGSIEQHGPHLPLGTDSLASCDSLNIFDEMAFVKDHYPGIDPGIIFSMGTVYGARALGLEGLTGTLEKGKKAQFLYRAVNIKNKKDIFQGVTSSE